MNTNSGRKLAAGLASTLFLAGWAIIAHRYPQAVGIVIGGAMAILLATRSPWTHAPALVWFGGCLVTAIMIGPVRSGVDQVVGWFGVGGGFIYVTVHSIDAFSYYWRRLFQCD